MSRLSTAPGSLGSDRSTDLQWLKDGICSRPPTPHSMKKSRLVKGPSPMKLPTSDLNASTPNFPVLPSLVKSGSSKLSRKFSRRSTLDQMKSMKSDDSVEFDKLELLTQNQPVQQSISNHRQYGTSIDQEKRISISANLRRFSSTTLTPSQTSSKSGFLDFFRRGSAPSSKSKDFDDLSVFKPAVVVGDLNKKRSETHVIRTMQPRSPRYGGSRDRHASLPEIERLIKMSQKRNGSSSAKNNEKTMAGRVRALKIDH